MIATLDEFRNKLLPNALGCQTFAETAYDILLGLSNRDTMAQLLGSSAYADQAETIARLMAWCATELRRKEAR